MACPDARVRRSHAPLAEEVMSLSIDAHQVPTEPVPVDEPPPEQNPVPDKEPVPDHNPVSAVLPGERPPHS